MRLTDTLKIQNIKVPLAASSKTDAIRELIDLLKAGGIWVSPAEVEERLAITRERPPVVNVAATMALEHYTAMMAHEFLAHPRHFAGADRPHLQLLAPGEEQSPRSPGPIDRTLNLGSPPANKAPPRRAK